MGRHDGSPKASEDCGLAGQVECLASNRAAKFVGENAPETGGAPHEENGASRQRGEVHVVLTASMIACRGARAKAQAPRSYDTPFQKRARWDPDCRKLRRRSSRPIKKLK